MDDITKQTMSDVAYVVGYGLGLMTLVTMFWCALLALVTAVSSC